MTTMPREATFTPDKKYGVYVHIPFCKAKCAYCAFVSVPDMSLQAAYTDALIGEIRRSPAKGAAVDTLYIGGGTPSCLFRGGITRIIDAVRSSFYVASDAEITVEANPESADDMFVSECISCGVNRISMGLQSASDDVLRAVGRLHTRDGFIAAAERIRAAGIDNLSSDIILGLPLSKPDDICRAVDISSRYCSHMSVYALTVEEGTPLCKRGYVPDDDAVADMYALACRELYAHGFCRYEVSNFAKPGCESKHNRKYWACEPYLGFGAAAHGYDGDRVRSYHSDSIAEYIAGTPQMYTVLSDKDVYNEFIMLALRTEGGFTYSALDARVGGTVEHCKRAAAGLISRGALITEGDRIRIAPDKMFVMNGIIEELML